MKKFYIFLSVLILSIFIVSYLVTKDVFISTQFSTIIDIINVTQVLISIYIAYLLYDRFGTSKKILDKQNEIILSYLEELKKLRIHIYLFEGEKLKIQVNTNISKNMNFSREIFEDKKIMLVKSGYFSLEKIQKFNDLTNHPLFPTELKNELDIFNYSVLTSTLSEKKDGFAFFSLEPETDFDMSKWMIPGRKEDITITDFFDKIENLLKTVENWVNKESSITIKLNF